MGPCSLSPKPETSIVQPSVRENSPIEFATQRTLGKFLVQIFLSFPTHSKDSKEKARNQCRGRVPAGKEFITWHL